MSPTGHSLARLDEWLAPYLAGATGRADLERLDLGVLLRAQLPWPLGAELDQLAPPTWRNGRSTTPPSGRRCPCACRTSSASPSTRRSPAGACRSTIALLSPADRPIQVTADLPGFWGGSWAAVRKELAGRYPKHRWPVDPAWRSDMMDGR